MISHVMKQRATYAIDATDAIMCSNTKVLYYDIRSVMFFFGSIPLKFDPNDLNGKEQNCQSYHILLMSLIRQ